MRKDTDITFYINGFLTLLIILLFLSLPFFWSHRLLTFQFAKKMLFILILLLIAPLAALLSLYKQDNALKRDRFFENPVFYWILFLFFSAISALFCQNYSLAGEMIMEWASYFLIFVIALKLEKYQLKWGLLSIAIAVLIISIYTFLEYGGLISSHWKSGQPAATVGNPNFLGEYLVIAVPLAGACGFIFHDKRVGLFAYISAISGFFAGILTYSRGTWLGLFVALSFFLFYKVKKHLNRDGIIRLTIWSTVLFMAFLAWPKSAKRLAPMLVSADRTGDFRLLTWKGTCDLAKTSPFLGIGPGNYPIRYDRFRPYDEIVGISGHDAWVKNPHNDYLHILAENGAIGLILYLAIIFFSIRKNFIRLWKTGKIKDDHSANNEDLTESAQAQAYILILAGILGTMAQAVVSSNFFRSLSASHFWFATALFYGSFATFSQNLRKMPDGDIFHGFKNWPIISFFRDLKVWPKGDLSFKLSSILPFVFSGLGIIFTLFLLIGDLYFVQGHKFSGRAKYFPPNHKERLEYQEKALKSFEKSTVFWPSRLDSPFERAQIYASRGEGDKAIMEYQELLRLYPEYRNAMNNYGGILMQKGDIKGAEKLFLKAVELCPTYYLAHTNLGAIYISMALNKANESKNTSDHPLSQDEENMWKQAESLCKKGQDHLMKSLIIKPDHPEALKNMGIAYLYFHEDIRRARLFLKKYIQVKSDASDKDAILNILGSGTNP